MLIYGEGQNEDRLRLSIRLIFPIGFPSVFVRVLNGSFSVSTKRPKKRNMSTRRRIRYGLRRMTDLLKREKWVENRFAGLYM